MTRRPLTTAGIFLAAAVAMPVLSRLHLLGNTGAGYLVDAACVVLMALSLNILMGYAGQISLGHGGFLSIGAFTAGIVTARHYLPSGLGLVLAMAIGGGVALLLGIPALRLRGLYLAIITIGFAVVTENSIFKLRALTGGSAGIDVERPYVGSFEFARNADLLALVLVVLALVWLVDWNLVRTRFGRAFFGLRENEQVAQSFGVDIARYKLLAFALSGALASLAGALHGTYIGSVNSESYTFREFSIPLVVLVVVGGMGSRAGVAVAAVAFTLAPLLLESLEGWDLVVGAALLVYTVARHPGGMADAFREIAHAKAAKAARTSGTADHVADPADDEIPPLPALPRPSTLPPRPPLPEGVPLLEVSGVTVRFGGLVAVRDAALSVPAGRIVGLIGPNGAGKSTLFNAVSGFVPMATGRISYRGQAIEHLPPHARAGLGIGRTFQHIGLARNLSVLENLLLAQHDVARYDLASALAFLPAAGRVEAELVGRAHEAIAALGFEAYTDTPVKNLSGGQQRIVELACTLVTAPELLLLDEPSAGMAPAAVENLAGRLRELRDDLGRTVLLIEHHIPLVLDVCDEIYVLNFGEVLAHGTPAEIASHPEVIAAYLGDAGSPPPRRRRRRQLVPA